MVGVGSVLVLVLGGWSGMLSDGVARKKMMMSVVEWRIGGTLVVVVVVVIESCLTRQAVSRPRHGQQWALSGPGSGFRVPPTKAMAS